MRPVTATIYLAKGYGMLVAPEGESWMLNFRWTANVQRTPTGLEKVYGYRRQRIDGRKRIIYAHREIVARRIGWETLNGYVVDHRDSIGTHNWGGNLRVVTQHFNTLIADRGSVSDYFRVTCENYPSHPRQKPWRARIKDPMTGKDLHLGYFATEEAAARAYDEKAMEYRYPTHFAHALIQFPNPPEVPEDDIPF